MNRINTLRSLPVAIATVLGLMVFTSAQAEPSIPVVPGKYEMVNDLVETKTTNCFTSNKLSAEVIRAQMEAEGGNEQCRIVDSRLDGNQLILDLTCQYDATEKGTGTMAVSTSEDTVTVKSEFRLVVEGQERSIEMESVGKRIGGC